MKTIFFILVCCVSVNVIAQNEVAPRFNVSLEKEIDNVQSVNLSEVAKNIRYIPLESPNDTLLKYVFYFKVADSRIALYCMRSTTLLYDYSGNLVR